MKCVIFARVSSKEQAFGYSLSAQGEFIRNYAKKNDFTIIKEFTVPESAKGSEERKIFKELFKFVEQNEIQIILCEKVDRMTRNLDDHAYLYAWSKAAPGREVHFTKQGLVLSKYASSNEQLNIDIQAILAKNFITNLSEEVKKGQLGKLNDGWRPHRPVPGYMSTVENQRIIHIQNPSTAPIVKKLLELYATGNYSGRRIAKLAYESGLRSSKGGRLPLSRIYLILAEPFYYGYIKWNNELYKGKHEPLITQELYNQIRLVKSGKSAPKYHKHFHPYRGLINCIGCGKKITWETAKGHWYGHCNFRYRDCGKRAYVRQEVIDKEFTRLLTPIESIGKPILEWVKTALKDNYQQEQKYHQESIRELEIIKDKYIRRLNKMYEDRLDGIIKVEAYENKAKEYNQKIDDALNGIKQHEEAKQSYVELSIKVLELASNAVSAYEKANPEQKRILLSAIFSNLVWDGNNLVPDYRKPFDLIVKSAESDDWQSN